MKRPGAFIGVLGIALLLSFPLNVQAQTARLINFQGSLEASTEPGTVSMIFELFIPGGNLPVWSEEQDVMLTTLGDFQAWLGNATPFPETLFEQNEELTLHITVDGEELAQTYELSSVPFAMRSFSADKLTTNVVRSPFEVDEGNASLTLEAPAENETVIAYNAGSGQAGLSFQNGLDGVAMKMTGDLNVGIGTETPQAKLDVNGAIQTGAGQPFMVRYGEGEISLSPALEPDDGRVYDDTQVNFGFEFSENPIVVITGASQGGRKDALILSIRSLSRTGFEVHLYNSSDGNASGTYRFTWMAMGR